MILQMETARPGGNGAGGGIGSHVADFHHTPGRIARQRHRDYAAYRADVARLARIGGEQVDRATAFLARCGRLKHVNKSVGSAGHLKHIAERWHRARGAHDPYISRRAFIAAAIRSGFTVTWDEDRPEAWLNISARDVARLRKEATR